MIAAFRQHGLSCSSISCRTTWASAAPTIRCGSTCSSGARNPAYAGWFDIDWEPHRGYLARKAARAGARRAVRRRARRGQARAATRRSAASSPSGRTTPQAADLSAALRRRARRRASAARAARRRVRALREWRPQVERRADELEARARAAAQRRRGVRAALARRSSAFNAPTTMARGARSTPLIQQQYWRAATSASRATTSTTAASSTSTTSRACASSCPKSSSMRTASCSRCCARACSTACASITSTGSSIRRRISSGCALALDARRRARSISSSRRSSRAASRCAETWPVEGTTGYEFANLVLRVLTDPAARTPLTRLYREHTGRVGAVRGGRARQQARILRNEMASELNVLAREAARVARQNARTADFTRNVLRRALRETIASFPVYRTYLAADGELPAADRSISGRRSRRRAAARARRSTRACSIFSSGCSPAISWRRRAADSAARGIALRDEVPAAERSGDGQGTGGHGVLPIQPAHRAQRGGRRPAACRRRSRSSTPPTRSVRGCRRTDCSRRRLTTRSAARTRVPGSRCWRRFRRSGRSRCAHGGDCCAERRRRRPPPDAQRRLPSIRRCSALAAGLCDARDRRASLAHSRDARAP